MKLLALMLAVALASVGCAHSQRPERKVYVISDDASGVSSNDASGIGGSGAEAYCNELRKQCFNQCWNQKPDIPTIKKHSASTLSTAPRNALRPSCDASRNRRNWSDKRSRRSSFISRTWMTRSTG